MSQAARATCLPQPLAAHHALQAKRAASAEGTDIPAIPITVRQLEAVIRIAESLAKMQLQVGLGAGRMEDMGARSSCWDQRA